MVEKVLSGLKQGPVLPTHSQAPPNLPPSASGTREVAQIVWERAGEGDWGAYSGSGSLTTRKERSCRNGASGPGGAAQQGLGGSREARTLIALGAWELPQGLGGGEVRSTGTPKWSLRCKTWELPPGMLRPAAKVRKGETTGRVLRASRTGGGQGEERQTLPSTPTFTGGFSPSLALRGPGLPHDQSSRVRGSGCPSHSSSPSF